MQRIAVVDYGMGNLRSVAKALDLVSSGNQEVVVTADADIIADAPANTATKKPVTAKKRHQATPKVTRKASTSTTEVMNTGGLIFMSPQRGDRAVIVSERRGAGRRPRFRSRAACPSRRDAPTSVRARVGR